MSVPLAGRLVVARLLLAAAGAGAIGTVRSRSRLAEQRQRAAVAAGHRDLVFMHIPYNFGHTVESVAMLEDTAERKASYTKYMVMELLSPNKSTELLLSEGNPDGELWGHADPQLLKNSSVGCSLYFTPQKYWPADLASKYFGNKTRFGILRDPYERLVAMFRGDLPGYGGNFDSELREKCDVNGAVKLVMQETLGGANPFREDCSFLPQAEYFEGPYGIELAVDNRLFPQAMNEVFKDHGYADMVIHDEDVYHVSGCNDVWSADFDDETRHMIQQFYKKDFELLCQYFGYCDKNESTCIKGVQEMCPTKVLSQLTE